MDRTVHMIISKSGRLKYATKNIGPPLEPTNQQGAVVPDVGTLSAPWPHHQEDGAVPRREEYNWASFGVYFGKEIINRHQFGS